MHIHYIRNKVSTASALLAKLKHYLPKYVLKLIYNSLCLSHITYALPVWGAAPTSAIGRLQKLHKKGIRHVCNSKYNAHTEPLFKKEKMLKLHDIYKLQCVKLMYKKIHNILHSYHTSRLTTHFELTQTNTRNKDDIIIEKPINSQSKMYFINYKVGTSWNELDLHVRRYALKSVPTFKRHIKKWYISKYSYICTIDHCYICKA